METLNALAKYVEDRPHSIAIYDRLMRLVTLLSRRAMARLSRSGVNPPRLISDICLALPYFG